MQQRDVKRISKLVTANETAIGVKVAANRAMALIDNYELFGILEGRIPMSKATTLMVTAWLYANGLIRFVNSHKKTQNSIDMGLDNKVVKTIYGDLITGNVRGMPVVQFPFPRSNDSTSGIISTIRKYSKSTTNPQIDLINPPRNYQGHFDEASGVLLNDDLQLTIAYHVANMVGKINGGDFAMSAIFEAIEKHINERRKLRLSDIVKFIKDLEQVLPEHKIKDILTAKNAVNKMDIPDINPNIPPHDYQWKGVSWIMEAERGVLAFGTGLGKTYISILFTYVAKRSGLIKGSIVFTKEKIITDFAREVKKFWPTAKVTILHGNPDERIGRMQEAAESDIVICSYGPLTRQMPEMIEFFNDNKEFAMFFDEGSRIRNTNTNMNEAVRQIIDGRRYVVILDATPFPNDVVTDAYNLIDMLRNNQLGTMRAWRKQFATKVESTLSTGRSGYVYNNVGELQEKISPFIYVKREDDPDVDAELPPERHEFDKIITLGPKQQIWYAKAVEMTLDELVNMMDPRNSNFKNPRNVLASIMRQRQVAISPRLIDSTYSGDEDRLEAIVDQAEEWLLSEDKTTITIGAEFRSIFPALKRQLLTRMPFLSENEIQELSGQTTGLKNIDAVKDGINSGTIKIGLLGITAAGAGINLQSNCHRVILLHKPWNPNKTSQFIDRFDRQGQKKRVTVIHYIADETIDLHIEDVLARKAWEQEQVLHGSGTVEKRTKLTIEELAGIAGISRSKLSEHAKKRGITGTNIDEYLNEEVSAREIE